MCRDIEQNLTSDGIEKNQSQHFVKIIKVIGKLFNFLIINRI